MGETIMNEQSKLFLRSLPYDNSCHKHEIIVDNAIIDSFYSYLDNVTLEDYSIYMGVKPIKSLLMELDKQGVFKKFAGEVGTESVVTTSSDDFLGIPSFTITSKKNMPKKIHIYGIDDGRESILYCNYWLTPFATTLKEGRLLKVDTKINKDTLEIGLSYNFRKCFFNVDDKAKIIKEFVKKLIKA
jgi:hypothetical protein